jgi:hypothetical protein
MDYIKKDLRILQIRMYEHNTHLQDNDVILQVLYVFSQDSVPILKYPELGLVFLLMKEKMIQC